MSVRIERVEPLGTHPGGFEADRGEKRTVLSGFPPEAVVAAMKAQREVDRRIEGGELGDEYEAMEAALAAAWRALTGEADK